MSIANTLKKRCGFRASFPKVYVAEPTGRRYHRHFAWFKERYELHHHVQITDPAIVAAATLSHRYISDRMFAR